MLLFGTFTLVGLDRVCNRLILIHAGIIHASVGDRC